MEIINTDPNAAMNQRLKEIELSKEYSLARKNNPELFGSMTFDQYKSSLYERVTSLEGDDRYNYINKWLKDVQQAAHTRGRNVKEFRSMYDEYVAERYRRTTPTTLDEGDEFYVKNALKDYVEHKGKPDEQAFYDRYLERVRRYNELNSVDGEIPPALYTVPYNAQGTTKPAYASNLPRGGIVTDPSQILGIGGAPVRRAPPNDPGYIKPPSIDDPVRLDELIYRLVNNETSSAATSFGSAKIKTSKTSASRKAEPVKPLTRSINVDMLDYSAYTGRSEYISRALLGRKAALMYMSRKSKETAGMPVTDISRR